MNKRHKKLGDKIKKRGFFKLNHIVIVFFILAFIILPIAIIYVVYSQNQIINKNEFIKSFELNKEKTLAHIELLRNVPKNISKIKFNFLIGNKSYVYEKNVFINGTEMPYSYSYDISSSELGIANFVGIKKVSVFFENQTQKNITNDINNTVPVNLTKNETKLPVKSGGGGGGGSGSGGGGGGSGGGGTTPVTGCINNLTNTTKSAWVNITSCQSDNTLNQSRNWIQYDINNCQTYANETFFENRSIACGTSCSSNLTNTTKSNWVNISACVNNFINQTRNWIQYDSNNCGLYANETFSEKRSIACGTSCSPYLTNTTKSDWVNITSCQPDNTLNQTRNWTQYDSNNCGTYVNVTFFENRTIFCKHTYSSNISISTLKDSYSPGEKINLTDPPSDFLSSEIKDVVNPPAYPFKLSTIYGEQNKKQYSVSLSQEQIDEISKVYEEKINLEKVNREKNIIIQGKLETIETDLNSILIKYNISLDKLKEIDEINLKNPGWIANFNPIFLKTDDEKRIICGLMESKGFSNKISDDKPFMALSGSALPLYFDWRNVSNKNYISPVKDQGNCGSCWAFGASGVLEAMSNIYFNNITNPNLSEQDLISCYKFDGCCGAYDNEIEYLYSNYWKNTGQANGTSFSYKKCDNLPGHCYGQAADSCSAANPPYGISCSQKSSNWQIGAWKANSYARINLSNNAVENIKKALIEKGPVEVGFYVYSDFFSYKGGIYTRTSDTYVGGHAVVIVGYGNYDGRDYWIVKNSWGKNWGENGYFRIYTGECNIDSWFAITAANLVPPVSMEKICEDKDHDGYCNWGLGTKPLSKCASCASVEDCDDSNASISQGCGMSISGMGTINITTNIIKARIYIKDQVSGNYIYRGTSPLITNLNSGQREINISSDDFIDNITTIYINENQNTDLYVYLNYNSKISLPMNNDILRAGDIISINGTTSNIKFQSYKIEWTKGTGNPKDGIWMTTGINLSNDGKQPILDGVLGIWNTSFITEPDFYTLRLYINKNDGTNDTRFIHKLYFDPKIKQGWPKYIPFNSKSKYQAAHIVPTVEDIDNDGFKEIILLDMYNTYSNVPANLIVFDYNGSIKWNQSIKKIISSSLISISDVDNDGFKEIFLTINGNIYSDDKIYAYRYNGTPMEYNWPVELPSFSEGLMIADLDYDGKKEIITKTINTSSFPVNNRLINIFDYKGSLISQFGINTWLSSWAGYERFISVGKFDDSFNLEIATHYNDSGIAIYYENGTMMNGWPQYIGGNIVGSLVTVDIDKDNYDEIIATAENRSTVEFDSTGGGIYAFYRNGTLMNGWPVLVDKNFMNTPAIGDVNNDGFPEIIVSDESTNVYVINKDGGILNGWPIHNSYVQTYFSNAVGDINNDGLPDILTNGGGIQPTLLQCGNFDASGGLRAWNFNGTPIDLNGNNPNFTFFTDYNGDSGYPIITDIDSNGKTDIIFTSEMNNAWCPLKTGDITNCQKKDEVIDDYCIIRSKNRSSLYVIELDSKYNSSFTPWPMYMHDSSHTGCYDCNETFISKPQSKVVNNEENPLIGILTLILQKNNSGNWENESIVVNQQVTIPGNGLLKLDTGKDNLNNQVFSGWNNLNVACEETGKYRVYASFEVNGQISNANWEFDSIEGLPSIGINNILILIFLIITIILIVYLFIIHGKKIKRNKRKKS